MSELVALEHLDRSLLGPDPETFVRALGRPSLFRLPGHDRSRVRALSTLLHGNEFSGIRALHRYLVSGQTPATDVVVFIGAVAAALEPPVFSHRAAPGQPDLNRCFQPPFAGLAGRIAERALSLLLGARPEALVDLHNTSGSSPPYGVVTGQDPAREALTALFAQHLVVTDQRLGTLLEATEDDFPTIVIECGQAGDPAADEVAVRGLAEYLGRESLWNVAAPLDVLRHPVRVELDKGARIAFDSAPVADVDLTLRPDADKHNFSVVDADYVLGWLGPRGLDVLRARDGAGRERTRELFHDRDGHLTTACRLKPLMVTTDPHIASFDCLFYLVEVSEC